MALDVYTLHFASAASRGAYIVVFLVLAISQRRQTHLWQWMGAMGASMVGSLIMMRVKPGELPMLHESVIIYGLYGASLVLAWTGLRSFFGRPVSVGLGLILAVLPGLIYPVLLGVGVTIRFALVAVFSACLVPALLSAYETVRVSAGAERLVAQSIEAVAFGSYALAFVLSIGMLAGTDMPIASAESARTSMVLDQIMGVFVYFGFVAMAAERANQTLLRLAETDPLTGLSNRRGLQALLHRWFPRPLVGPAGGVLILDIDHFKAINDRLGHAGGDLVLTAFAIRMKTTLKSKLRSKDMVARWGGEEFLIVLPGICANDLVSIAERLRTSIAEVPFLLPSGPLAVTVSIGGAMIGPREGSFEDGVRKADAALYDAKAQGRNRVCCKLTAHSVPKEASTQMTILD